MCDCCEPSSVNLSVGIPRFTGDLECHWYPSLTDIRGEASEFNATLDAHGLYNSIQFVLRLSPEVHRRLSSMTSGVVSSAEVGFDGAKAFSTFLHETIHWWQHVGSTHGLMTSLSYPSQTHANHTLIKRLIENGELRKPIRKLANVLPGPGGPGTLLGIANTIVNNHFDLSAFRRLSYDTESAKKLVGDPFFESLAHSIEITYAHNLIAMSGAADVDFKTLPDPRDWEGAFRKLAEEKIEGFYYGSPVGLWPIGVGEIMEGQACFSQIQYVYFASGKQLTWDDFRQFGMLYGVYQKAFEEFLIRTHLEWPETIEHPAVGLFLLICDMALNAGSGFPFSPAPHFPSFVDDTIPGIRFTTLSTMLRLQAPDLLGVVQEYSRDEYVRISERLSGIMFDRSPVEIANLCTQWADGPMSALMKEYETFEYGPVNTVARVLLSHFLSFMQDKQANPEFFCWPGRWMAGEEIHERGPALFERHAALFMDKEEDDGVFPRVHANRDENRVQEMFDTFYAATVVYDLTDQLICRDGPFNYDGYRWLKPTASPEEFRLFADRSFRNIYGIEPASIPVI